MSEKIKIGTRGSHLALWQANYTMSQLLTFGIKSELCIIKTQGDKIQDLSFDKLEGKGFFTKEIEDALLRGEVDMAVHSMKDLPTVAPDGLVTTAVSYRENPADWLLIRKDRLDSERLLSLPNNAIVGTSSARRKAQILDFRPDVVLKDLRGNVPTRVEKLRTETYDAIILAAAGLSRLELNLSDIEVIELNPQEFVPAPAQGVLAFQTRESDFEIRRILKNLHHSDVSAVTNVERRALQLMGGGCHLPLGVYCERDADQNYHVWAAVADTWDSPLRRVRLSSSTTFGLAEEIIAKLNH